MADRIDPRAVLTALFDAAVRACAPAICVPRHLPAPPRGRTVVVGAGKAAAAMARALETHWDGPLSGLVVTRYGHGVDCDRIEVVEAAHPVPDEAGARAARQVLERVRGLGPEDLVLALISGGGSSLLNAPAPGISLACKQAINRALLTSGATISEINCVRKHLSAVKGGRLALACRPARVHTLVISDVPGDDPAAVASGPTVPDPTTFAQAREVLARYGIREPHTVIEHLERAEDETPKPGDPRLEGHTVTVIASAGSALEAAAACAREHGVEPRILGDRIEGEARVVGADHAARVWRLLDERRMSDPPMALLSGGETTVTVRGGGRGGRNVEYLLSLALELDGVAGVSAIACDTDGIDGTENNAGAIAVDDTLERARALGLDARARLEDNDAWSFFHALGDLVITGPTRTNVNDFRAVLIAPE